MVHAHGTEDAYALAAQEDRSAPRSRVSIPASLRASGGKGFRTVVHDLSLSGFSAAAVNRLHPGTICWLSLPGLESLQAEVIWWNNSIVGCAFAQMMSPVVHENIVSRFPGGDGVFRPLA